MKKKISLFYFLFAIITCNAQEFNCKVIVNASQIQGVDPKIWKTLEQSLTDFVNTRKWTTDEFDAKEKISCNFQLTVLKKIESLDNGYVGKLNIQASRPVYGTNYNTSTLNFADKDITFKYVQFQGIDFNESRIAGTDAYISNLSAIFAYYAYLIIGLDYDSYKLKAGTEFYNKALNIINNAPEDKEIDGWKNNAKTIKNRFGIIDNLLNSRLTNFRDQFYNYHRNGLDKLTKEPIKARNVILSTIPILSQMSVENPNLALLSIFFAAKSDEYYNFLQKTPFADRQTYIPLIANMDVTNAIRYNSLLK